MASVFELIFSVFMLSGLHVLRPSFHITRSSIVDGQNAATIILQANSLTRQKFIAILIVL